MKPGAVQDQPVKPGAVQDQPVKTGTVQDQPVKPGAVQDQPVKTGTVQDQPVKPGAVQDQPVQLARHSVRSRQAAQPHTSNSQPCVHHQSHLGPFLSQPHRPYTQCTGQVSASHTQTTHCVLCARSPAVQSGKGV